MGYIRHDAVLVTVAGYMEGKPDMPDVAAFRQSLPESWRPLVIGPVKTVANGDLNFAFLADGSKEGWSDSDDGDEYRFKFIELFGAAYGDGSSPFSVAQVRYGGDEPYKTYAVVPPKRIGDLT